MKHHALWLLAVLLLVADIYLLAFRPLEGWLLPLLDSYRTTQPAPDPMPRFAPPRPPEPSFRLDILSG